MTETIMEVENLSKHFGSLVAVDDVSLTVNSDEITSLIGPNGAGKTTFYNLVSGNLAPTTGTVHLNGEDITDLRPNERNNRGLGRSFQINNLYEGISTRRNLRIPLIAESSIRRNLFRKVDSYDGINEKVEELLSLLNIEPEYADTVVSELPYGAKRRIEIGVGLAQEPDLLLLDEPTAGMTPEETKAMVALIKNLEAETDTTFFLTEHDMDVVFGVSDRILVLDQGHVIADGTPEMVRQSAQVRSAYLGEDRTYLEDRTSSKSRQSAPNGRKPLLDVENIHTYYGNSHVLNGVSLDVDEGEIVGLLGRNGAGKTTTLKSIVGINPPRSGEIRLQGERIDQLPSHKIAGRGIAYVPEDREVFTSLTVEDNLKVTMAEDSRWSLEDVYELLPALEVNADSYGDELSGGEEQMVAIARALLTDPKLFVLDEPTEGLAPVIVDDIHDLLLEITDMDVTVLLTEQNTDFALSLTDRNYILNRGQVEWEGETDELMEADDLLEKHLSVGE